MRYLIRDRIVMEMLNVKVYNIQCLIMYLVQVYFGNFCDFVYGW